MGKGKGRVPHDPQKRLSEADHCYGFFYPADEGGGEQKRYLFWIERGKSVAPTMVTFFVGVASLYNTRVRCRIRKDGQRSRRKDQRGEENRRWWRIHRIEIIYLLLYTTINSAVVDLRFKFTVFWSNTLIFLNIHW